MNETIVYTNRQGDSCVRNWSVDDLNLAFKIAEETGDDILYMAIMSEVERLHLLIEEAKSHLTNPPE